MASKLDGGLGDLLIVGAVILFFVLAALFTRAGNSGKTGVKNINEDYFVNYSDCLEAVSSFNKGAIEHGTGQYASCHAMTGGYQMIVTQDGEVMNKKIMK